MFVGDERQFVVQVISDKMLVVAEQGALLLRQLPGVLGELGLESEHQPVVLARIEILPVAQRLHVPHERAQQVEVFTVGELLSRGAKQVGTDVVGEARDALGAVGNIVEAVGRKQATRLGAPGGVGRKTGLVTRFVLRSGRVVHVVGTDVLRTAQDDRPAVGVKEIPAVAGLGNAEKALRTPHRDGFAVIEPPAPRGFDMEIDRPEPVHARHGAGLGGIGDVAPGNGFGDGPATELAVDQPPELDLRIGVLGQVAGTGPLLGIRRRVVGAGRKKACAKNRKEKFLHGAKTF